VAPPHPTADEVGEGEGLQDFAEGREARLGSHQGDGIVLSHILSGDMEELLGADNGEGLILREGVFSSGEMPALRDGKEIFEQFLVFKGLYGLVIVTGCAHPGVYRICKNV